MGVSFSDPMSEELPVSTAVLGPEELEDWEMVGGEQESSESATSSMGSFSAADTPEDSPPTLEESSWFDTLSSFLSWPANSMADLLAQVTAGIRLTAKKSATEKNPTPFHHALHQFDASFNIGFEVKEYCVGAFQELREKLYLIDTADYFEEWTLPEEQLSASEGAGRSGALFCFSRTRKFIFKTIFRSETETLLGAIRHYHRYCHDNPDTLIMRMLGLYCFSRVSVTNSEMYVLVFANVAWSGIDQPLKIHETYDLKGRRTKTLRFHDEAAEDEKGVRKDKHLARLFYTGGYRRALLEQLRRDVGLLERHNLMDYSLFIAVHHQNDSEPVEASPHHPACLGSSQFRQYRGGFPAGEELLFVGIIDCLTYYGTAKKLAHGFKSLLWSKEQLSTVQAQFYSERFLQYMEDIFPVGEKPTVNPFLPCAATNADENFTMMLHAVKEVLLKNTAPSEDLSNSRDFEVIARHAMAMPSPSGEAYSITIKEYAPTIFARLRSEWGHDAKALADDLDLPLLQIQANCMPVYDENGNDTGLTMPSNSKRFLVETINQRDVWNLYNTLSPYTNYMMKNHDSLMCRVLGIYKASIGMLTRVYVLVMENPEYCSPRYSFVGKRLYSLQGIRTRQPLPPLQDASRYLSRSAVFSDRNLDRNFSLGSQRDELVRLLTRDIEYLRSQSMIQYTLIVSVGRVMEKDGNEVPVEEVEAARRGLTESPFGEWVLLGGIHTIWKRYGAREVLSSSFSLLTGRAETKSATDPQFYAERFTNMFDYALTR